MARMSRWKWTQPLGLPVVPEVKAIRAGASAAVSTGSKTVPAGRAWAAFCRPAESMTWVREAVAARASATASAKGA